MRKDGCNMPECPSAPQVFTRTEVKGQRSSCLLVKKHTCVQRWRKRSCATPSHGNCLKDDQLLSLCVHTCLVAMATLPLEPERTTSQIPSFISAADFSIFALSALPPTIIPPLFHALSLSVSVSLSHQSRKQS